MQWDRLSSSILPDVDYPDERIENESSSSRIWYLESERFGGWTRRILFRKRLAVQQLGISICELNYGIFLGMRWSTFLMERFMDPLGMKGSRSIVDPDTENVAKAYIALSETVMCVLTRPRQEAVCGSGWYTE